ncbi:MAG: leucine--tRNA ligase, partial [Nanoarchaeota archaeon]|nr:leucine--tRNA ligase [Nanoarchaeota archaeon]
MIKTIYNFKKIEEKWQRKWGQSKIFNVKENKKKKFYVLEMYPYPSGSGLHMGHTFNYTIGDIYARFKMMQGFNVRYPMGYDSFGLPAQNAAIEEGAHPKTYTERSINNFIKQQRELGLSYDWSRILMTHKPDYYKWNQFFFLKFFEKGFAYKKKAPVNFCEKCNTVLANEQVHNGKCWRHPNTGIQVKHLEQWFIKTTDYVEELLSMTDDLEWPARIKAMQKNWIGKSHGTEIEFNINGKKLSVFTTRPDTLYGVTFMVVSAQHTDLEEFVTKGQEKKVKDFLKKIKTTKQEDLDKLDKEGVFSGSYGINPINDEKIPVWIGNFVVADYGSGMVMAVPAHDQRDFEFAKRYNLPIIEVIKPKDFKYDPSKQAYEGEGILINSGRFTGMKSEQAKERITEWLRRKGSAKKAVHYKLRDWIFSRQRYWGEPIPMIKCEKCGWQPVLEQDLPVKLPKINNYKPTEKGQSPLAKAKTWIKVACPECGNAARRETDVMPNWAGSNWYYLRYCDPINDKKLADPKKLEHWMPVDWYNGGMEHTTLHLLYSRFIYKFLRDIKAVPRSIGSEPYQKRTSHGIILGQGGVKMSKSKGNVINPEKVVKEYGADTM